VAKLTEVSIAEAQRALRSAMVADVPIHFVGPPGVGKSAIVEAFARDAGVPCETLLLSLCDPTDVGGLPIAQPDGSVVRLPLGQIARAARGPVILFGDEYTTAPPSVQNAFLRVVLARWAGDVRLHSGTRPILASNPPDQTSGGSETPLAMIGRVQTFALRPTVVEVSSYMAQLGPEESTLRMLGVDLAATLESRPDLIQFDPPAGTLQSGTPWGAPRAWERGLRHVTAELDSGAPESDPFLATCLAGAIGEDMAGAWVAIRHVRGKLPARAEIVRDPKGSKLPTDVESGVGALGLLAQVALEDPCAAWVYGARVGQGPSDPLAEVRIALTRSLIRHGIESSRKSKHYADATRARVVMLGAIGRDAAEVA